MIELKKINGLWVVMDVEAERVYGRYPSFESARRHKEIMQEGEEKKRRALAQNQQIKADATGA